MTNDEKAKAYDEALERARKIHNEILDNEILGFPDQIREIFPELRGSEDERIRKELINFLRSPFIKENLTDEKVAPWLAWLEKQKEQKPAEWSEEDEKMRDRIIDILNSTFSVYSALGTSSTRPPCPTYKDEINWLKSLRPSWKPSEAQMKALWDAYKGGKEQEPLRELIEQLKKL